MIPYILHPEAEAEIDAAAAVYEAQQSGLGTSFVAAVEHAVSFMRTYPESGARVTGPYRRVLVRRFPYAVVYRLDPEHAFVIAVAHVRRRLGYWLHRA
ncbi:MAG: type II toxin-antitoxin system RelE/ParE family toxin [Chloroflexota bacterium]